MSTWIYVFQKMSFWQQKWQTSDRNFENTRFPKVIAYACAVFVQWQLLCTLSMADNIYRNIFTFSGTRLFWIFGQPKHFRLLLVGSYFCVLLVPPENTKCKVRKDIKCPLSQFSKSKVVRNIESSYAVQATER